MARVAKKGMIEVQINWLFILIAGAVILLVAFSFVTKLRASSKIQIADSLVKDIEAIATGAQIAKGGAQTIPIPKVNIQFGCSKECTCGFRVGPAEKSFKEKLFFAPDNLEDIEIIFLSLAWKVPFRIDNFLFATNKFVKYYVVHDKNDAQAQRMVDVFKKKLPKGMKIDYIAQSDVSKLDSTAFDEVKFMYLYTPDLTVGQLDAALSKFAKVDYNVVHVGFNNDVTFFDKKNKKKAGLRNPVSAGYLGDTALFGALFADDSNMYVCNMQKALIRMGNIAKVYSQRAGLLADAADAGGRIGHCAGYADSVLLLDSLSSEAFTAAGTADPGAVGSLVSSVAMLEQQNNQKLLESCPLLY